MAKGDHLVISFGPYQHHALDLGDGRVIQYGGGWLANNRIETARMDSFPARRTVRKIDTPACFEPDVIVERALGRMGEDNYRLFSNNCEHFVTWCRTGKATSYQVRRATRRGTSAAIKLLAAPIGKLGMRRAGSLVARQAFRTASPWLALADVAQWGTEAMASHRGLSDGQSKTAGVAAGLSASAGIGVLVAGPIGAAAGVGVWAVGETAGTWLRPR